MTMPDPGTFSPKIASAKSSRLLKKLKSARLQGGIISIVEG
jgi:hypothetical protein